MSKRNGKPIRFARLIRVSTERQKERGHSLQVQDKDTANAIESLGGKVTTTYGGHEHGTAGWEREQLDKLLTDAQKQRKPFDAIMVTEPVRWSRDNAKSKEGLEILRANGIRFFTLTNEQDLFDPTARLLLGMSAEIGEYQAYIQTQKAMHSKIERAKLGYPTAGTKPWGRDFDKQTATWSIDEEKQEQIRDIAERYIAGEAIADLAEEYGYSNGIIYDVLNNRCGPDFVQRFQSTTLNIDETVTTKIPRLLPAKTIKAVATRIAKNRTAPKRKSKEWFVLAGYARCAYCGRKLTPQPREAGRRFYRHAANDCEHRSEVYPKADALEEAVVEVLFETFGNAAAIKDAVQRAIPNKEKVQKLLERQKRLQANRDEAAQQIARLMEFAARGDYAGGVATKMVNDLEAKRDRFNEQLDKVEGELSGIPRLKSNISSARYRIAKRKRPTTFAQKRALVEEVFEGMLSDGRSPGVYVYAGEGPREKKTWKFTVCGLITGGICSVTDSGSP